MPEYLDALKAKHIFKERSKKGYPDELLLAATQTKGVIRKEEYECRIVIVQKDFHLLKLVKEDDFVISLRSFQGGVEYAYHITDHLRREDVVIEPDNIAEGAVRIGEEITEKLEYNPGEIFVRRVIRPKYALKGGEGILIAPLPEQVLDRSNAGSSLLAHLIVSKYVDHLPFYRQIEIFKRHDLHLPASTVNDWFKSTCSLLRTICFAETTKQPSWQLLHIAY